MVLFSYGMVISYIFIQLLRNGAVTLSCFNLPFDMVINIMPNFDIQFINYTITVIETLSCNIFLLLLNYHDDKTLLINYTNRYEVILILCIYNP